MDNSLVDKAQTVTHKNSGLDKEKPGEVELAIALIYDEVTITQVSKTLSIKSPSVYSWALKKLKKAVSLGLLVRK